jgi:hypothetical protein
MPYSIQPYKSGFRVYSISGTPLSKKPLTKSKALLQLRAVYAAYGRKQKKLKGGSKEELDAAEIDTIEKYSLSESDLKDLLGPGIPVFTYEDLLTTNRIEDIFDKQGRAIMLYLTESKTVGHWVCLIKKKGVIEYFNSYGNLEPDEELKWLSKAKAQELNQDTKKLSELLDNSKFKEVINPYRFQQYKTDVNTCGRHVVCRLMFDHLDIKEYKALLDDAITELEKQTKKKMNYDDFVCEYTYFLNHFNK